MVERTCYKVMIGIILGKNFMSLNDMIIFIFHFFLRKNQFLPIFYAQNGNFSIFVGALTL